MPGHDAVLRPAAQVGLLRSRSTEGIPRRRMQSLVVQLDLLEREMSDDTEPGNAERPLPGPFGLRI